MGKHGFLEDRIEVFQVLRDLMIVDLNDTFRRTVVGIT